MGPLEQQVVEEMDRVLAGTPAGLEALFSGETGVREATPEETAQFLMSMLVAQRTGLRLIARHIDELGSS